MKLFAIAVLVATSLLSALPAHAQTVRIAADEPVCFMHWGDRVMDLTSMCGNAATLPAAATGSRSGSVANRGSNGYAQEGVWYSRPPIFGTSSGGSCNLPTDRDSTGRQCGDRAASVRRGGR